MLMPSRHGATPGTTLIASTAIAARGVSDTVLIGDVAHTGGTAVIMAVITTRFTTLIIPITAGDITVHTTGTGTALITTIPLITGIMAAKRTTGMFPKESNPTWVVIPVMPEAALHLKR